MSRFAGMLLIFAVAAGIRVEFDRRYGLDSAPVPLRIPLSDFDNPRLIDRFRGTDAKLAQGVIRAAGVSDYLNREYSDGKRTVWFYIGYADTWRIRAIHSPEACFPSTGLTQADRNEIVVDLGDGKESRFDEYVWNRGGIRDIYTLSSFYYLGNFAPSELDLRWGRRLGTRWFAVVTISGHFLGDLEETRKEYTKMLKQLYPTLLRHLPASNDGTVPEER
ncbi:MAG: exosortase-associated EpsI family protein [Planctomycetota bacterium]